MLLSLLLQCAVVLSKVFVIIDLTEMYTKSNTQSCHPCNPDTDTKPTRQRIYQCQCYRQTPTTTTKYKDQLLGRDRLHQHDHRYGRDREYKPMLLSFFASSGEPEKPLKMMQALLCHPRQNPPLYVRIQTACKNVRTSAERQAASCYQPCRCGGPHG